MSERRTLRGGAASHELTDEGVDALRLKEEALVGLADQPLVFLPAEVAGRKTRRVLPRGCKHVRVAGREQPPRLVGQQEVDKAQRG